MRLLKLKKFFLSAVIAVAATGITALGQTTLSPGVADVGKLAAARVPEEMIINFAKSSGVSYHLTPDDIIYLNGQGATPNVMAFLQNTPPPAAPAPEAAPSPPPPPPTPPADASAAPAPQIDLPYFQAQLGPYGTWIDYPPYGAVWRPGIAMNDPLWRPYCQGGHWVMTDAGWYWQADDPWGAVVFHYGRWIFDAANGWLWVPGYNWAPSWVCWRRTDGFYGWAPLPPQAEFVTGVGLAVGGVAVEASFDFGLGSSAFTFVGYDHLWEHDYGVVMLPSARVDIVFGASVIQNSYHVDHGRFVVEGFGRHDLDVRVGHPVEVVEINKQVTVEHTTVVNNITSVRNVTIRNNVTNVRNVSNTTNVRNTTDVHNVANVSNTRNVNNTENVHNVASTRNEGNMRNPGAVHAPAAAAQPTRPNVAATAPATHPIAPPTAAPAYAAQRAAPPASHPAYPAPAGAPAVGHPHGTNAPAQHHP